MKKIIIAIDGHSSCGKSTLAKQLGKKLGYNYISTGDMYRAVTLFFIRNEVNILDEQAVTDALEKIDIRFENTSTGTQIFLNGENVQKEIRKMYVANKVSPVATISAVRRKLVKAQHLLGEEKGIVMDGRDIGTVVFPNAELKIFLTAHVSKRADRRYKELIEKGHEVELEAVKHNLNERDRIDSNRKDSPLKKATDAVLVDNTNLSPKEQLAMVAVLARCRMRLEV